MRFGAAGVLEIANMRYIGSESAVLVNCAERILTMRHARLPPVFIGHDIYRHAGYGGNHPLAIARVGPVLDLCEALGWFGPGEYEASPRAAEIELARFHHPDYIRALRDACAQGKVEASVRERYRFGIMENPLFPGLYERAATSVGGSVLAARLALEGRIAYHPPGGTHHGRPNRASGFCYFNDPVFAILTLLDGDLERVLYVDFDAHHGDAVQDAFASDARVFTLSVHEQGRWPHTGAIDDRGAGRTCNVPVPAGFNDAELRVVMNEVVRPLVAALEPQAVVLTCGADALAGDPLATMQLSNVALCDSVVELANSAPAAVVLGGGGYNPWTVARYWTALWARLSGRSIPSQLPAAAAAILARLRCDLVDEQDVHPEWLTTLADPLADASVRPELRRVVDTALALIDRHCWSLAPTSMALPT